MNTLAREAPGPGMFLAIRRLIAGGRPLADMAQDLATYGDVVQYRILGKRAILFRHPDHIRYVLDTHHPNFGKSSLSREALRELLGTGLLTSTGELWRRQRRLMQPAFGKESMLRLAPMMVEDTQRMLERWSQSSAEPVDVHVEMGRLALAIAGRTMFLTDVGAVADTVGRTITEMSQESELLSRPFAALPRWIPVPGQANRAAAIRRLDEVVMGIIAGRRETQSNGHDLLSLLMAARDEDGAPMSDRQVRDEVMTLLIAGHETTANLLAWTFYLLSHHQMVEERLVAEVRTVVGTRAVTAADVPKLLYLQQVIQESMRLYPPAWVMTREAHGNEVVGGYRVPAGAILLLSPYFTHRHPAVWERPEQFDPERFAPGQDQGRPKHAYFPFGGGQRFCIGAPFAMLEAPLVIASVLQRFRLRMVSDTPVEPLASATLRPRGGLPMRRIPAEA
jgi:cytochrome P450